MLTERFFQHDLARCGTGHHAQSLRDNGEETWHNRKVEDVFAFPQSSEIPVEHTEHLRAGEIHLEITHLRRKTDEVRFGERQAREPFHPFTGTGVVALVGIFPAADDQNFGILRELSVQPHTVKGGQQLVKGQIPRLAKDGKQSFFRHCPAPHAW